MNKTVKTPKLPKTNFTMYLYAFTVRVTDGSKSPFKKGIVITPSLIITCVMNLYLKQSGECQIPDSTAVENGELLELPN